MTRTIWLALLITGLALGSENPNWIPSRIVSIDYPLLAIQSKTYGNVEIECVLRRDGTVENARVVSGSQLLGNFIVRGIREWKFMPNTIGPNPSAGLLSLYFEYKLGEGADGNPKSSFVYDYPNHFTISSKSLLRTH